MISESLSCWTNSRYMKCIPPKMKRNKKKHWRKSGGIISIFLLQKIALAVLVPLSFVMNFKISFSITTGAPHGILIRTALTIYIKFGEIDILPLFNFFFSIFCSMNNTITFFLLRFSSAMLFGFHCLGHQQALSDLVLSILDFLKLL